MNILPKNWLYKKKNMADTKEITGKEQQDLLNSFNDHEGSDQC